MSKDFNQLVSEAEVKAVRDGHRAEIAGFVSSLSDDAVADLGVKVAERFRSFSERTALCMKSFDELTSICGQATDPDTRHQTARRIAGLIQELPALRFFLDQVRKENGR